MLRGSSETVASLRTSELPVTSTVIDNVGAPCDIPDTRVLRQPTNADYNGRSQWRPLRLVARSGAVRGDHESRHRADNVRGAEGEREGIPREFGGLRNFADVHIRARVQGLDLEAGAGRWMLRRRGLHRDQVTGIHHVVIVQEHDARA